MASIQIFSNGLADLQVLKDLGDEYNDVILSSFHSISKGFYGECGRRGGYMELINLPKDVFGELVKLASIDLCSNLNGQICTALMMNPPQVRQRIGRPPQAHLVALTLYTRLYFESVGAIAVPSNKGLADILRKIAIFAYLERSGSDLHSLCLLKAV